MLNTEYPPIRAFTRSCRGSPRRLDFFYGPTSTYQIFTPIYMKSNEAITKTSRHEAFDLLRPRAEKVARRFFRGYPATSGLVTPMDVEDFLAEAHLTTLAIIDKHLGKRPFEIQSLVGIAVWARLRTYVQDTCSLFPSSVILSSRYIEKVKESYKIRNGKKLSADQIVLIYAREQRIRKTDVAKRKRRGIVVTPLPMFREPWFAAWSNGILRNYNGGIYKERPYNEIDTLEYIDCITKSMSQERKIALRLLFEGYSKAEIERRIGRSEKFVIQTVKKFRNRFENMQRSSGSIFLNKIRENPLEHLNPRD